MPRPVKLLWVASRVVKASTELTWPQKAVWLELQTLDQSEQGAFISARSLAARIGLSEPAVEKRRQELLGLGLLVAARGGRRTASWFAILPEACRPTSEKLTVEQIESLVARLDRTLAAAHPTPKPMSPGVVTLLHARRGEKRPEMSPGVVTVVPLALPANVTPHIIAPAAIVTPHIIAPAAIVTPVSAAEASNVTRGGAPEDSQTRISDFSPVRMNALTSEGECEGETPDGEDRAIAHDGGEDRTEPLPCEQWRTKLDPPPSYRRRASAGGPAAPISDVLKGLQLPRPA